MFQETITPDTPLGDTERILTQAPISRDQKVTKQSTIPTGIKQKTVETLLIEDAAEVQGIQGQRVPHDQDIASQFPKYTREGAELERVNSWDEFLKALLKYETFDRLVLLFHRIPGSIAI